MANKDALSYVQLQLECITNLSMEANEHMLQAEQARRHQNARLFEKHRQSARAAANTAVERSGLLTIWTREVLQHAMKHLLYDALHRMRTDTRISSDDMVFVAEGSEWVENVRETHATALATAQLAEELML